MGDGNGGMSVGQAWTRSSRAFDRLVKPILRETLQGEFGIVERITKEPPVGSDDWMAANLDILAGIDVWFVHAERGFRGIASRVQWGDEGSGRYPSVYPYRTFTVRWERDSGAKTEYQKRREAMQSEWLWPFYTLQAYCTNDRPERLLTFAIAKTRDVFALIEAGECYGRHTGNAQKGQAGFYCVEWESLADGRFWFVEWTPHGSRCLKPTSPVASVPPRLPKSPVAQAAFALEGTN